MAFNIYTPSKNPKEVFTIITIVVSAGILGSLLISDYFLVVALLFWIHFTSVLSYLQFSKGRKYGMTSFTNFLLNPQFRFFIFIFIAVIGIFSIFYITPLIGYTALITWWLFSLNFYRHYTKFKG